MACHRDHLVVGVVEAEEEEDRRRWMGVGEVVLQGVLQVVRVVHGIGVVEVGGVRCSMPGI